MSSSYYSLDHHLHYIYQEGRTVFKYAVANMSDSCEAIIARNHLTKEEVDWVIPHQLTSVSLPLWRNDSKYRPRK